MKQLEVTILGQSYLLACPDGGEAQLQAAVSLVDHEMSTIRDAGKVRARERMAVLAALNLAYQLAERPNARAAERPAAPENTAARGADDSAISAEDALMVEYLIERIDHSLGDDGRLL